MSVRSSSTLWLAVMAITLLAGMSFAQQCPPSTSASAMPPSATAMTPAPMMVQPGVAVAPNAALTDYTTLWSNRPTRRITGEIVSIGHFYPGGREAGAGVELVLKPGLEPDEMMPQWLENDLGNSFRIVQLGPEWAVDQSLPNLRLGQVITVVGTPVTYGKRPVLLAQSVSRGTRMVALRAPTGAPMWAGGWPAWSYGARVVTAFNPNTVQTVSGRIQELRTEEVVSGMGASTVALLQTSDGRLLRVDLAPGWFLQQTGFQPAVGQDIIATGSLVDINGQAVLLVTSLQSGGRQFTLRSSTGAPAWAIASASPYYSSPGTVVYSEPGGATSAVPVTPSPIPAPQANAGMQTF
jgi:hypothetical protein